VRKPRRSTSCSRILALSLALALLISGPVPALAADRLVFIDPGHGGVYNQAQANGLIEKNVNLWLSLELRSQLQTAGFDVGMTRTTDVALTTRDLNTWHWDAARGIWRFYKDGKVMGDPPTDDLQARCNAANNAGADVYVSIHMNGSTSTGARGTETWSAPDDELGNSLSRYVQQAMIQETGMVNRGSKEIDFYVLKWTNMPAILIEGGFITNPTDASLLRTQAFRARMAKGIVTGLQRWLATDPFRGLYPRYGGATPADVAVAASMAQFPGTSTVDSLLLISSDDATSAMTVAPLARKLGAPVLVADASGLPTATAVELARLAPAHVVAIGPAGPLPDAVLAQAQAAAGAGADSRRIAGTDLYETAALVAEEVGVPASGRVVVASGAWFADAISGSSAAVVDTAPVLLTAPGGVLSPATAAFFAAHTGRISKTVVVGLPTGVLPSAVATLPGVTRIAGAADWYQTNVAVLRSLWPTARISPFVADWRPSASTVVAAAAAARTGQPLVLTGGRVVSSYTREWMQNMRTRVARWTIVGTDAEQPDVADWLVRKSAGAIVPPPVPTLTPTGTVTIGAVPSSVYLPRPFVLSGTVKGAPTGDAVVVWVKKPGSGRWSYSSKRLIYGNSQWWYRYTPRLRGYYQFKTAHAAFAGVPAGTSRIISVRIR
jgi:N-acetylmuramoyl-L-alanine amidase